MYATCLYCKSDLGSNESVETFPVGGRLAFDAEKGRLWVVCGRCRRWNLSPLEERWEAIEECERLFRDTRRQVTTDNIGLAGLPDGTDLVRIGRPARPEFAAWRYGTQFLRRRRRKHMNIALSGGVNAAFVSGLVPLVWPLLVPFAAWDLVRAHRTVARIPGDGDEAIQVARKHVKSIRLMPRDVPEGWGIAIRAGRRDTELAGPEALRLVGLVLPHVNQKGASESQVSKAVAELERAGGPDAFFRSSAERMSRYQHLGVVPEDHQIRRAPLEIQLGLEMAAHEESERRALEGELHVLERAWQEAEEIAAIADSLLIPESVRESLRRLRTFGV